MEIRGRIFTATQLTASAGIACNKLLAKMATGINKPNGQYYVVPDRDTAIEFIQKQDIVKAPGIGKYYGKLLNELGIKLCGDILKKKFELSFVFNEDFFGFLIKTALGIGDIHHKEFEQ